MHQALKGPPASRKDFDPTDPLLEIDRLTETHAAAFGTLAGTMAELDGKIAALKADYLPSLRAQVADVKSSHAVLNAAITQCADAFAKPRTRVMHGFTVGLRKQLGEIAFSDAENSIRLIEKHFPDQAGLLIATKKSIVKNAVAQLTAGELKKIGGEITDPVDEVVIKSAIGDVVRLVDALIKEQAAA